MDPEIDVAAISAEIGEELFAKDGVGEVPPAGETGEDPPVAVQQAAPGETPLPAYKPLPKSWKKEVEPIWARAPAELHEYVYQREADVTRGIQQYSQGHQRWNALTAPFQQVFAQDPNFDPTPVLQNLMNTHLMLANPQVSVAQKKEFLLQAAKSYGFELSPAQAAQAAAENGVPDISQHPEFVAMNQRLLQHEQFLRQQQQTMQQRQQQEYQAALEANQKTVNAFTSDPKNKYFPDVADDVLRLIQTGAANDLAAAYEMAIWANPTVRQKLLAEQQEQLAQNGNNGRKPALPNIEGSGSARPKSSRKPATLDDTIDAVIAKHHPSH